MRKFQVLTEKMLSREDKFQGKIVGVHVDKIELPDGRTSIREVVDHVDGVAVLPLDEHNNVLTVTQYRYVFGKRFARTEGGNRCCPRRTDLSGPHSPLSGLLRRNAAYVSRPRSSHGGTGSGSR